MGVSVNNYHMYNFYSVFILALDETDYTILKLKFIRHTPHLLSSSLLSLF